MFGLSFDRPDAWRDGYDAWKTRAPEYDDREPPCQTCGSTWEDEGADWAVSWRGGERVVAPFGWCPECGWRCELCPDIEDLYERCGDQSQ